MLSLFGRHLRKLRIASGFDTQERFAMRAGIPRTTLSQVESGIRGPLTEQQFLRAMDVCGVAVDGEPSPAFARWQVLRGWTWMLRRLPVQALTGRVFLEALGEAVADGRMSRDAWARLHRALDPDFREDGDAR